MRIFFLSAWGSILVLIALWRRGTRRGHVSCTGWLAGLVSGECLFSFPQFSKHNLFNLFVFLFSVLYFVCDLSDPLFFLTPFLASSLCVVPLSVTVATAHFAPPFPHIFTLFSRYALCLHFFPFLFCRALLLLCICFEFQIFPKWRIILKLGTHLPPSPFFLLG